MPQNDPFAIVEPVEDDDPFKIVEPVQPANVQAVPDLQIVETVADDSVDEDNRKTGESFFQKFFMRSASGFENGATMGDYLVDPQMGMMLDRQAQADLLENDPEVRAAYAENLRTLSEPVIGAGQSLREGLTAPSPFSGGRADPRGVIISQGIEEFARLVSSNVEAISPAAYDASQQDIDFSYNLARTIREATRTPEEELAEEGTFYGFSRALAQTGSFALGAKGAGKVFGWGNKAMAATAAWLGAAVGGQMGAEDAKAHGATDDQILMARLLNNAIGTSEALPIGHLIQRIDDASSGFLTNKIKSNAARVAAGGFLGLLEEGLQELGQTYGENWIAGSLVGYDPGRDINSGVWEAAAMGGSVGLTLNLLATYVGVRNRARTEAQIKEQILDPLGLTSLDQIAGPFSLLSDRYLELQKDPELRAFRDLLRRQGDEDFPLEVQAENEVGQATVRVAGYPGETPVSAGYRASELRVGNQIDTAEMIADHYWQHNNTDDTPKYTLAAKVDPRHRVEGESDSVASAVARNPEGVITAIQRYNNESAPSFFMTEMEIQALQDIVDGGGTLTAAQRTDLNNAIFRRDVMRGIQEEMDLLSQDLETLVTKLKPLLGDVKTAIVVEDQSLHAKNSPAHGEYSALFIGGGPTRTLVNRLAISTKNLVAALSRKATRIYQHNQAVARNDSQEVSDLKPLLKMAEQVVLREKASLLGTVVHEFGHMMGYNVFDIVLRNLGASGVATDEMRQVALSLRNDYFRFLRDNLNADAVEAAAAIGAINRYAGAVQALGFDVDVSTLDSIALASVSASPVGNTWDAARLRGTTDHQQIDQQLDHYFYIFNFQEYMAEQMTKIAQGNSELVQPELLPYFKEAVDKTNQAMSIASQSLKKVHAPTLELFWKTHSIRQAMSSIEQILGKRPTSLDNPFVAAEAGGLLTREQRDRLTGEGDTFNKFMDLGFNILQIAEQNPHIHGLQQYVANLRAWKNEVNNNLAIAEGRLNEWKELGKEENEKLGRILYDESIGRTPDGGWLAEPRHFTEEEIAKYNLSERALALREAIHDDFKRTLTQMEEVLTASNKRIYAELPQELGRQLLKLRRDFNNMRKKPYFPLMRFGDYVLEIRANGDQTFEGRNYKDGQIVEWQTFDSKRERDRALQGELKRYPREKILHSVGKRVLPNFSLQGMPITLLEHLEKKLSSHELAPEVREAIAQAKNDALPFRSFRKQFQRRKRVEGYSIDAMRTYANYMTSFANHIGRVKYDADFKDSFDAVEDSIDIIRRKNESNWTKRAEIMNHMTQHLNYVMNPVNEFVGLRSAAFMYYLGFNVKSAAVNLTQVPLVTYPYLAARFGDGKAVAALARANKNAIKAVRNPEKLSEELRELINKGITENWLDESLATELALAASEPNLGKSIPRHWGNKAWLKASQYGSYLFHQAEKINRHVTAMAAYQLARDSGLSAPRAQEEARRAVEKTQFEYARWARPKFMRGRFGGTVFVFQNYMQNALYFALGGDPGALRMLIMLFLVAGLQGLPFGDDIMDLVDAGMTVLKKKTGMKDPHTQVRVDLRNWMHEMDVDPDLVMHGLSSSTFGLANLGEFMGWPIPDLDISGSLSMGRIVPGARLAPRFVSGGMSAEEAVGAIATEAGGAILSAGGGIGVKLMNQHPDTWKAWEKTMPSSLRSVSKGLRIKANEGEAARNGWPINEYDHYDIKDRLENYAQMFGFTPRETTEGWESYIAQQQSMKFYQTWRTNLLVEWNFAREKNDQEAVKDANKAIRDYNKQVPFPEMKIGAETRISSYENYVKSRRLNEREIEQSKIYRRLRDSVRGAFENEDRDSEDKQ